jgi:hypothetical protein
MDARRVSRPHTCKYLCLGSTTLSGGGGGGCRVLNPRFQAAVWMTASLSRALYTQPCEDTRNSGGGGGGGGRCWLLTWLVALVAVRVSRAWCYISCVAERREVPAGRGHGQPALGRWRAAWWGPQRNMGCCYYLYRWRGLQCLPHPSSSWQKLKKWEGHRWRNWSWLRLVRARHGQAVVWWNCWWVGDMLPYFATTAGPGPGGAGFCVCNATANTYSRT